MATIEKPRPAGDTAPGLLETASWRKVLREGRESYTLRIVLQGVVTAWAAISLTFFLIRLLPGNPIDLHIETLLNQGYTIEQARNQAAGLFNYDPDQPLIEQYFAYFADLLRGDLGQSITSSGTPVIAQIMRFLPWTLVSLGSALLISIVVGTVVGMAMAYWRGSPFDNFMTSTASILSGLPDYVYAIGIILIAGVQLQWFDVGDMRGGVDPNIDPGFTSEYIGSVIAHASLPGLTYVLASVGIWILLMKSSTISTLGEDYIAVAKARGLSERRILMAYVGRNSLLPVIPRIAINIGFVVGGSVVVERLFEYPGLGRALFTAVSTRDYMTMQGIFILITLTMIAANTISDLVIAWLDPRIRLGEE